MILVAREPNSFKGNLYLIENNTSPKASSPISYAARIAANRYNRRNQHLVVRKWEIQTTSSFCGDRFFKVKGKSTATTQAPSIEILSGRFVFPLTARAEFFPGGHYRALGKDQLSSSDTTFLAVNSYLVVQNQSTIRKKGTKKRVRADIPWYSSSWSLSTLIFFM